MPQRHFDGTVLRRERRARDISQGDVAERIGVKRQQLTKWEQNQIVPTLDKLPAIADALGMPLDELFPRDGAPDLQDLRHDAGLTQKEASNLIGASSTPVLYAERGRRRLDSPYVGPLARAYKVTEDQLLAAQDRSFGVGSPTPRRDSLGARMTRLLEAAGAPGDSELATRINERAGRALVSAQQIAELRTDKLHPPQIFSDPAEEAGFMDALAGALGVSPVVLKPDEAAILQVVGMIKDLAADRGLALAARGAEEYGIDPTMWSQLSKVLAAGADPKGPFSGG